MGFSAFCISKTPRMEAMIWNGKTCGTVKRLEESQGYCEFTEYELYPGVKMQLNDVHMRSVHEECSDERLLEINYCAEGCYECEFKSNGYSRVTEGCFAACGMGRAKALSRFPTCRYRGVSVVLDAERAQRHMDAAYPELMIDISDLPERMCPGGTCFTAHADGALKQLFDALMDPPDCARDGYYRVKMLELMTILSAWHPGESDGDRYLRRGARERMTLVRDQLSRQLDMEMTMDELSRAHGMSEGQLKRTFMRVYGISPAAYRRSCRMEYAAKLLRETDETITDIAMQVGYLNPGKFAGAFRAEMGMPPALYRKSTMPFWST